jgi:hypothetical protein
MKASVHSLCYLAVYEVRKYVAKLHKTQNKVVIICKSLAVSQRYLTVCIVQNLQGHIYNSFFLQYIFTSCYIFGVPRTLV